MPEVFADRFELLQVLGEGRMGKVYLARDSLRSDDRLALKVLSNLGGDLDQFRHEFLTLASLSHPNLVRVFHFGQAGGSFYYTYEFVEGQNLADADLEWPQLYEALAGVCRGLAFLHARGLMHYDIKPENIIVQPAGAPGEDRRVKLLDFGLAGPERVVATGGLRGSLPTMAPELLKGLPADRRADLYSVGATIYRVVAGRNLYDADTESDYLRARLERDPPPLRNFRPDVPAALEEVVARLLAREPSARYPGANAVIAALSKAAGRQLEQETRGTREAWLLSGPFVGRDRELERLRERARAVLLADKPGEGARVLLVTAEEGMGRRRLLSEFRHDLQVRGVFCAGGEVSESATPFEPFLRMLRELYAGRPRPPVFDALAPPAQAAASGAGRAEVQPQERLKMLTSLTDAIFDGLVDRSGGAAGLVDRSGGEPAGRPVALLLDSFERADEASIDLLFALVRSRERLAGSRLIVVLGVLDPDSEGGRMARAIRDLAEEDLAEEVRLGRLSREDVRAFVAGMLPGTSLPASFFERLEKETRGSPRTIEEYLRALVELGALAPIPGGDGWSLDEEAFEKLRTPREVLDLLALRVARLDEASLKVLAVAASVGASLTPPEFREVLSRCWGAAQASAAAPDEDPVYVPLKNLTARGLLVVQPGGRYELGYPGLARLELGKPSEREALHRAIGEWLASRGAPIEDQARHFRRGKDAERGVRACLAAARRSLSLHAYDRAVEFFSALLDLAGTRDEFLPARVEALAGLGRARTARGEHERAVEALEELLALDLAATRRAEVLGDLASVYLRKGELGRAREYIEDAEEVLKAGRGDSSAARSDASAVLSRLMILLAGVERQAGRHERGVEAAHRALDLAETAGDGRLFARGALALGELRLAEGDLDKARAAFEDARRRASSAGESAVLAAALTGLSGILSTRGELAAASEACTEALDIQDRLGDIAGAAATKGRMAELELRRGELDRAEALWTAGESVLARLGDVRGQARCLEKLAVLAWQKADYVRAVELQDRAATAFDRVGDEPGKALTLLGMAGIASDLNDQDSAHRHLENAMAGFRRTGDRSFEPACLALSAEIYLREGALGHARDELERALASARERGDRLEEARVLITMGRLAATSARQQEAMTQAQRAMNLSTELSFRSEEVAARVLVGRLFLVAGELARAEDILSEAIAGAEARKLPELEWRALAARGEVRHRLGDDEGAKMDLRRARERVEAISSRVPMDDIERYQNESERAAVLSGAGLAPRPPAPSSAAINEKYRRLLALNARLNAQLDPDRVLEMIMDTAIDLTGAERGFLVLLDPNAPPMEPPDASPPLPAPQRAEGAVAGAAAGADPRAAQGEEPAEPFDAAPRYRFAVTRNFDQLEIVRPEFKVSYTILGEVIGKGRPVLLNDAQEDARFADVGSVLNLQLLSVVCMPFVVKGVVRGAIYLENRFRAGAFDEEDLEIINFLNDQVAIAFENAGLYQEAIKDAMTGLYARNYFFGRLDEEMRRAARFQKGFCLMLIEVENLKLVRDLYGHGVGDRVLLEVVGLIRNRLRRIDVVGRLRGDRFGIILVETGERGAMIIARRIERELARRSFQAGAREVVLSPSVGIASYLDELEDPESLVRKAERALDEAKERVADRVVLFGSELDEADKADVLSEDVDSLILTREGRETLRLITSLVSAGLDLDKLLEILLDMIMEGTQAARGFFMLVEEDGSLTFAASRFIDADDLERREFEGVRSVLREVARTAHPLLLKNALEDERFQDIANPSAIHLRSICCVPVVDPGDPSRVLGVAYVDSHATERRFTDKDLNLLIGFAQRVGSPIKHSRAFREAEDELVRVERAYKESLRALQTRTHYQNIIGRSKPMQDVFALIDRIVDSEQAVLIHGESGTGKELVAQAIHFHGPRKEKPFVAENCAAFSEALLEAELFGHVKGAFTGADRDKKGLFEIADGGTLFLDEVGDMPREMQSKLLRVLQEGEIRPVGGREIMKVDVRIITASNKDVKALVELGTFREDLFYRLNVIRIHLPPLRERREDIPLLIEHFLADIAEREERPKHEFSAASMNKMLRYRWPGNIRELKNVVEQAVIMAPGSLVEEDLLHLEEEPPDAESAGTGGHSRLFLYPFDEAKDRFAIEYIQQLLARHEGNITHASREAGIKRQSLHQYIRKYGIDTDRFRKSESSSPPLRS